MVIVRSVVLFVVAALFEIGGAWLVWQGVREHRGWLWIGAGVMALGVYGFVATLQPDAEFGRILAAYGGVFVAKLARLGRGRGRLPPRPLGHQRRADLPRRHGRDHVRAARRALRRPAREADGLDARDGRLPILARTDHRMPYARARTPTCARPYAVRLWSSP